MSVQNTHYEGHNNFRSEFDRIDLLNSVISLREDFNSMATDLKEVLRENMKLKAEVDRLHESKSKQKSVSDLRRLKMELDQLLHLHESSSPGNGRFNQAAKYESSYRDPSTNSSWFKKMMMFMMMSELV